MPQIRLQSTLDALRKQHSTLVRALAPPELGTGPIHEEPSEYGSHAWQHARWGSKRTSIASSAGEMWFDAPEPDGALEFVLEDATPAESEGDMSSKTLANGSVNGSEQEVNETLGNEDDSDDEREEEHGKEESEVTAEAGKEERKEIVRRTQLPSGPVGDEGSLFAVLKKNVGKVRVSGRLVVLC